MDSRILLVFDEELQPILLKPLEKRERKGALLDSFYKVTIARILN